MRLKLAGIILAVLCSSLAVGQAPLPNLVLGCGASYNPNGSPEAAVSCLLAKQMQPRVYSFNGVDVFPIGKKSIDTSIFTGVATPLGSFSGFNVFAAGGIGFQTLAGDQTGPHLGWGWNGGFLADRKVYDKWGVIAAVRVNKGSATAGVGPQFIASLGVRYEF